MLNREPEEDGTIKQAYYNGTGFIAFSPLAQGLLTTRYLDGSIPPDSRMAHDHFLKRETLNDDMLANLTALNVIALQRGQTLPEMALAWVLRDETVTSVIIGASSVIQLADNLRACENTTFSEEERNRIRKVLS
jgi:L-glyceraldehyde 3-phosphate reductase